MRLTKVTASAFKGTDIACELGAVNIIHGGNFEGKTAIPDAINVGLFSHLPKLGRENSATFGLSSDPDQMVVELAFDDGQINHVLLTHTQEDGKDSYSKKESLSFDVPLVLMDTQEYFNLSGPERVKYVFDRIDLKAAGYDEANLLVDLSAVKVDAPKDVSEPIIKLSLRAVKESIDQRDKLKASIQTWTESLITRMDNTRKSSDKDAKRLQGAVQALKHDGPIPKDLRAELQKASAEFTDKQKEIAVSETQAEVKADTKLADTIQELEDSNEVDRMSIREYERAIESKKSTEKRMRALKCCPTCKSKGTDWLDEWLKEFNRECEELVERIKKIESGMKLRHEELVGLIKKQAEEARSTEPQKKSKKVLKLEEEAEKISKEHKRLSEEHSKWRTYQQNKDRREKSEKEYISAKCQADVLAKMIKLVREAQQSVVSNAFNTLLKVASQFTNGILQSPLEYLDGELGRMRGKVWVNHKAFSGSEQLLAYGGMSVALAQESPIKLVVMDELGRLTPENKCKLVTRMDQLCKKGVIDQFIGIDVDLDDYGPVKGKFKAIKVGAI